MKQCKALIQLQVSICLVYAKHIHVYKCYSEHVALFKAKGSASSQAKDIKTFSYPRSVLSTLGIRNEVD